MDKKLNKISCDPACGFEVQSHDEKEVMGMASKHALEKHSKTVSEKEARQMMVAV